MAIGFSITAIARRRDKLLREVFEPMGPIVLRGSVFEEFVDHVVAVMPKGVLRNAVFETLRHLAGSALTPQASFAAAWRLAGNVHRLKRGIPTPPWTVQTEHEWVPVEVTAGMPSRNHQNKAGTIFSFLIWAGSPCGMTIRLFWSNEVSRFVARRLGFSSMRGKFPYANPLELVRLRGVVLLDPALSRETPKFRQVREKLPSAFLTWNRNILRVRKRLEPCPRQFKHACHQCVVGYSECPGGVHRLTYRRDSCPVCGNESYFDDDVSAARCISCTHKRALRPRS